MTAFVHVVQSVRYHSGRDDNTGGPSYATSYFSFRMTPMHLDNWERHLVNGTRTFDTFGLIKEMNWICSYKILSCSFGKFFGKSLFNLIKLCSPLIKKPFYGFLGFWGKTVKWTK